ncbi:Uncharacterised protein [Enterobacter cloacae]|nr:Uncharacterised protein [Enterobacter cloacae]
MIDVAMGINNGNNRTFAAMLNVKIHARFSRFRRQQRIDNRDPLFALYNRHIRQIEVADLVDAFRDLKQTANIIQLRLTPQARVDGIRRFLPFFDKSVFLGVPDNGAFFVFNHRGWQRGNKAFVRISEIGLIKEGQLTIKCIIHLFRMGSGSLPFLLCQDRQ